VKINKTKREHLMTNAHYRNYDKKKESIKKKYPKSIFKKPSLGRTVDVYTDEERKLYQAYLKELTDLLFEPDGDYQKFTWEILSEQDKMIMERKARGRKWHYDYD
jgi:hypothetical protein